jgi:hypothetical protein
MNLMFLFREMAATSKKISQLCFLQRFEVSLNTDLFGQKGKKMNFKLKLESLQFWHL